MAQLPLPEDLVVMGRVAAPYAVSGWLKIQPFTESVDSLLDYPLWHIGKNGQWRACQLLEGKVHGQTLLVSLQGIADRNIAEAMQGFEIAVSRADLPPPDEDEYYWDQLTGLEVVNLQGESLGKVAGILETGAHEVLKIQAERDGKPFERLIPFVGALVQSVDLAGRRIVVDWGLDY
jgi:16S rRNA processing protein RimM